VIGATAAKRYSGKVILSLAVFMWSLSTFITPFFGESITILIVLRVILGIGEGLGKSCCHVLVSCMSSVQLQWTLDVSNEYICNLRLECLTLCSASLVAHDSIT